MDLILYFLVTPETSEERIKKLDKLSTGFLYAVSSSSTTGSNKNMTDVNSYLQKLKSLRLRNFIMVGFGIKDKQLLMRPASMPTGQLSGVLL